MFCWRPTNLVSYISSESVENTRLIQFSLTESLDFCSLHKGGTKIKVAKVLKDYGNIKVRFFVQEWNNIPDAMILHYLRSMRSPIIPCFNSRGSHTRYCLKNCKNFKVIKTQTYIPIGRGVLVLILDKSGDTVPSMVNSGYSTM